MDVFPALSSVGASSGGFVYCIFAPYVFLTLGWGWFCGFVEGGCWKRWSAFLMYVGIDRCTFWPTQSHFMVSLQYLLPSQLHEHLKYFLIVFRRCSAFSLPTYLLQNCLLQGRIGLGTTCATTVQALSHSVCSRGFIVNLPRVPA